jgi:hypothetical protein
MARRFGVSGSAALVVSSVRALPMPIASSWKSTQGWGKLSPVLHRKPGLPPNLMELVFDAHAPVGCCRHQGIRRTPRPNQSRSRLFTRAGRHQYAKHRRFRRLRRTPSSPQRPQSKIVCLGCRARSTSRFCLPAKCGMPLRATDPIAFHRPERSHNLSFSYPPKKRRAN